MALRHRTQVVEEPIVGKYTDYWGSDDEYQMPRYHPKSVCDDVVGRRDLDNPFDLYHLHTRFPVQYGKQVVGGTVYREIDHMPLNGANYPIDPRTWYPVLSPTQLHNYAWEILAKTNPSRPSISIPTAIGELKDVPDLVRSWGNDFLTQAANGNLWYQFGVRPLLSDIASLLKFIDEVNDLLRALKKLLNDGYLTRRCVLETSSSGKVLLAPGVFVQSLYSHLMKADRWRSCQTKTWGSCRWVLAGPLNIPEPDDELEKFLRRIVGGFTAQEGLATFWELVPWSWLVDWFINVQAFLNAINSQLPLEPEGICVMRTLTAKTAYDNYVTVLSAYNEGYRMDGQHWEMGVRKERYSVPRPSMPPTASIPALSAGQWSILASLLALRVRW